MEAQQASDSLKSYFNLGARYNYGVVFRHSRALPIETQSNPMGYELDFAWHFISQYARDYCNCYPRVGFSLYYWDYRNPDILGHGMTLMAFVEPFFNAHNRVSLSMRAGLGLNYQDKPYHPIDNPLNLAYSTHFAYAILLNFNANFKVSDHAKLILAANYNHISNGGIKLPNKGLNYPSFSFGVDYSFHKSRFNKIKTEDWKAESFERRWRKDFGLFLGFRGITDDESLYYVKGIFGQYAWQISRVSAFPFGLEYLHDGAELARSRIYQSISDKAANKVSIYSGYEYLLGKLVLSFNLGLYVYSPDRTSSIIYQRYGFRIQLFKMVFAGLNLKSHGHIAEFFDVRIGTSF
ncbi:MAG: acyloxyacyl hydrolase [Bacteroidota bacterium]|nr:acyloxyacyl hydrolase [Bacteroidota bacterium]